uniref:Glucose-methanol-choline oxidoreductase N-terminal domain-containing protein n=1 Tax=Moniliophthora roreri TaxID=221103 RepID=A0A0W0FX43_MONRR
MFHYLGSTSQTFRLAVHAASRTSRAFGDAANWVKKNATSAVHTCLSAWPPYSVARLLNNLSELDVNTRYDFIIVGGGTAGSVLANRLTEDGKSKVLVVEAGVNNEGVLTSEVPFFAGRNFGGPLDWNYTTIPQAGADGRQINVPRGFVLGGSSSINIMYWYRGSDDMWNNFAKLAGDDSWAWESVSKYYLKVLPVPLSDASAL